MSLHTQGRIGTGFSPRARDHVLRVLRERGVRIEEGRRIEGPGAEDADDAVRAASMIPNTELAAAAGLPLDPSGRIRVDGAPLAGVSRGVRRGGRARGELAEGGRAADGVRDRDAHGLARRFVESSRKFRGREPRQLDVRFLARCVSLGRRDALVQFRPPRRQPRDRFLTGRPAARAKEQVVRSTVGPLRLTVRRPWAVPLMPGVS
ncbi:hypothetical protein [Streptomyces sp. NPDC019507]|uniref:hypothetical protein n=1 Tax=Streptomyces sp. NPDC019507 TaxID=3154689 RepID=UPI0033E16B6A